MSEPPGVSFVIPVKDGRTWIGRVLDAVLSQADGRPMEVLVIDDGSTDGSLDVLRGYAERSAVRLLRGEGRGAAAAVNLGVREARQPIICQVDQDVIVGAGWMEHLLRAFQDPRVGAAQGYYVADRGASIWARVMGLDVEMRYERLREPCLDHVCTGNTAYRKAALEQAGLFDESLGYGYDADCSYKLGAAGFRLALCREARSVHRWREGVMAYLRQQYGFGYGRLDVVARHPRRARGDDVASLGMMAHAPAMLAALALGPAAAVTAALGGPWRMLALGAAFVVLLLFIERLVAGLRALGRFRDPAALLFPIAHLMRDLVWAVAIVVWGFRQATRRSSRPSDSMSG